MQYNAYNSILFLTESANVALLEDSSELAKYITAEELKTAFDSMDNEFNEPKRSRRFEYRFYGNRFTNDKFDADLILFQDMAKHGRDYHFQLRTYTKKRELIDKLDFAVWDEELRIHCEGKLTPELKIVKSYTDSLSEYWQLGNNGRFAGLN
ncbi:MAG TPA: hypothetical protein VEC12_01520 [Bacteroidia bacterium]|nr:hypothetical protein [Bacteroidia bacterium]